MCHPTKLKISNTTPNDDWSVDLLAAASACSEGTHKLLEDYQQRQTEAGAIPMEWFPEPTPGKSYSLNSAIPRLNGDVVAFVDDDHRVDANFLVNICRAADCHPDATLFCGRILPDWRFSYLLRKAYQRSRSISWASLCGTVQYTGSTT